MTDYMGYLKAYLQGFQSGYITALNINNEIAEEQQAPQTKRAKPSHYKRSPEGEAKRAAAIKKYWAKRKKK